MDPASPNRATSRNFIGENEMKFSKTAKLKILTESEMSEEQVQANRFMIQNILNEQSAFYRSAYERLKSDEIWQKKIRPSIQSDALIFPKNSIFSKNFE